MKNKLKVLFYSFITFFSILYFNQNIYSFESLKNLNMYFQNTSGIIQCFFIIILYIFYTNTYSLKSDRKLNLITTIGSVLYTLFIIIFNSYHITNSLLLVVASKTTLLMSVIKFIGLFVLIKNILKLLFIKIDGISLDEKSIKKDNNLFLIAILLILSYLPIIIIFYPGTMNMDSLFEIGQFYGKIKWTQHHPVFPTIIYGLFMKLGRMILNDNFGLFLSNIIQLIVSCIILSYCINIVYCITKSKFARWILFLYFIIFPIWSINFYSCVKDVWFSIFFLLFIIITVKLQYFKELSKKEWILYFISILFVILFRNNGIHIIILSIPFLYFIFDKDKRKAFLKCMIISICIGLSFNKIFTSIYRIDKGSIRETLSIPLQQTSRYVMTNELTTKESKIISKLVDINDIKENYNPQTVDYVKAEFKQNVSKKDLINYFNIWIKMFFKHPSTYLSATINSTYGYLYPNKTEFKDGVAQFIIDDYGVNVMNLDLKFNQKFEKTRNKIVDIINNIRYFPIIGILFNCGTYSWILIFDTLFLLYKKKKEILLLSPLYLVLLVCIASPVNALIRYMIPIMITLPFIQFWILKIKD